jgi:hypothetical protein
MLSTVGETAEAEQQPKVEEGEQLEDMVEVEVVEEEDEDEDKEVTRIFRMADDLQYSEAISKTRNHSISVMESADKGRGAAHQLIRKAKKNTNRLIIFFMQKTPLTYEICKTYKDRLF